jgi:sporadic carbohydrate cluster protein (TIGR04323 family)
MPTHKKPSYRGYIGSRTYHRDLPPQTIQNQIVRDFCHRKDASFLLSLTEYSMPECYIILNETLRETEQIEGLVLYSIFMLPTDKLQRERYVLKLLSSEVSIHGAAENISIYNIKDWYRVDDMLTLHHLSSSI